jgi:hypothetical protein
MASLIIFLQQYLVPFVFAIGLIYFIWGVINYFFFDGYEGVGREAFVKACSWLIVALLIHIASFLLVGLANLSLSTPTLQPGNAPTGEVEVRERQSVLPVPNVPRQEP